MKSYSFIFLCKQSGKDIRKIVNTQGECVGYALELAAKEAVSKFGTKDIYLESFSLINF
ncbi:hypothetical protein [Pseudoalteromonas sp. AC163]|jgi:hypothetical protein|uniref:hypothetical protein n=1 Tax=Pseudoalteromonas sp. AC163 TaxID=1055790 RepID=UPI0003F8C1F2|nr:hypothetical protein [Pseudoalteromonas sp. AC163]